jgi:hypothetical protein
MSAKSRIFLWCIRNQRSDGWVCGGRPVPAREIGEAIGMCRETVTRAMLDLDYYFRVARSHEGYRIAVRKNKKFTAYPVTGTSQPLCDANVTVEVSPGGNGVTSTSRRSDRHVTPSHLTRNNRNTGDCDGSVTPTPVTGTSQPQTAGDGRRQLTDQLVALWRARYHPRTGPHWAKGAYAQLDKLLKGGEPTDEIIRRFKTYLADDEKWVSGHDLMLFATRYDRWALSAEDQIPPEWRLDADS